MLAAWQWPIIAVVHKTLHNLTHSFIHSKHSTSLSTQSSNKWHNTHRLQVILLHWWHCCNAQCKTSSACYIYWIMFSIIWTSIVMSSYKQHNNKINPKQITSFSSQHTTIAVTQCYYAAQYHLKYVFYIWIVSQINLFNLNDDWRGVAWSSQQSKTAGPS